MPFGLFLGMRNRYGEPANMSAFLHVPKCVLGLDYREDLRGPNWGDVSLDVVF